ncbi:RidA family protein [Leifsonia lichenia]
MAPAYSPLVVANGFAFTAGQTPHHPETDEVVGAGIEEQTDAALRTLVALLAAHGMAASDVVKATVHLNDIERDFAGFDAAYRRWFAEPFPARTTVGSRLDGFLVEIDVVAVYPAPSPA